MRATLITFIFTAFLTACASTSAPDSRSTTTTEPGIQIDAPEIVHPQEFLVFLGEVNAKIKVDDPRKLTTAEKRRVNRLTVELESMLSDISTIETLSEQQRLEVFNSTQELWATVIGRDEDQVICRRDHRVGTHFKTTRCRTIEQIREDQERSRLMLRDSWNRGNTLPVPRG